MAEERRRRDSRLNELERIRKNVKTVYELCTVQLAAKRLTRDQSDVEGQFLKRRMVALGGKLIAGSC